MVQVMETWFLADQALLRESFGADFRPQHLREWPALENLSKDIVIDALVQATAGCSKSYAKGRVSYELLGMLSAERVEARCPRAKALLDRLRNL